MSGFCPGCRNIDKELEEARQAARKVADETGVSQAVYKDGDSYAYASALYACQYGLAIKEIMVAKK